MPLVYTLAPMLNGAVKKWTREHVSLNVSLEVGLLTRLDRWRFLNRFPTRLGAIRWLLYWALKQNPRVTKEEIESLPPN